MNAAYFLPLVGITLMIIGLLGVGAAAARTHKTQNRLDFIRSLGSEAEVYAAATPIVERVETPLVQRIFGPVVNGLRHSLSRLYPSSDIDRVHADLLKAGLTRSVRAEEFVAIQVGSVLLGIGAALVALVSGAVSIKIGLAMMFILPMIGGLGPSYWLRHRIKKRRQQVTNDLPDVLDLMCISVAAGLGLEQAMQVSCARFESPVSDELRLTLREMELGLSRHDALENLKLRTDIDDLMTLAVVLSQADALGLPIGRVLQAQADEMRDKRRQRAREKAAKVPVKILFPLAFCFLPAILIVVLGPLVGPIKHAFHQGGAG
jgi:tight adherence protein C